MRVAVYARVSKSDQDCALQIRETRQYIAARGWEPAGEYVDTGWSGAKASRPEFDRLRAAARKREFDCVVVWKLDRWGRSVQNCLESIEELTSLGIRWIAITQGLDTDQSNPMARFMLTIMAAFAAMERELLRERITAGLAAARDRGVRLGRQPVVVDRRKVADLRTQGLSIRQIAEKLHVSKSIVARLVPKSEPVDIREAKKRARTLQDALGASSEELSISGSPDDSRAISAPPEAILRAEPEPEPVLAVPEPTAAHTALWRQWQRGSI